MRFSGDLSDIVAGFAVIARRLDDDSPERNLTVVLSTHLNDKSSALIAFISVMVSPPFWYISLAEH